MASSRDLKRAMTENGHKVPDGDHGDGLKLQENKSTGESWCYCTKCNALGALKLDGRMYGLATTRGCRSSQNLNTPARNYQLT